MKVATPPCSWIPESGLRLHAGPYASGAVGLRRRLQHLQGDYLATLTKGDYGGIYTPPIHNFKRVYVEDPAFGVQFIGTTTMLHADFIGVPLLSREQAETDKLRILRLREGMTLISCSGTIGRVAYTRRDMDGMWSSGDILKVVPDEQKVDPGYLHAFLSSKAGVAAMVAETYGSIVPHIEASHIAQLPVPRLGESRELEIGNLVRQAASDRTAARASLESAQQVLRTRVLGVLSHAPSDLVSTANASALQSRMDAYYFSAKCSWARRIFDEARGSVGVELAEVATILIPGIFKRRYSTDPAYGYPYLTGADVFQLAPTSDRYLIRAVAEDNNLLVRRGTILIQEAGQLGGLIGHSVLVGRNFENTAVSNNMVRVTCPAPVDTAYLYALLSTPEGVSLVGRESAGSSIPHIDANRVRRMKVPWADAEIRREVAAFVLHAVSLRERACDAEAAARSVVEFSVDGKA